MLTQFQPVVPPAPKVHDKDLPGWRALFKFNRNTLSSQPQRAFEEPVIRRCIFGLESLLINDPDGIRHVLATAMDKYKRLVAADRILGPLGGTGLFLAAGAQWRQQRRMLAPQVFTRVDAFCGGKLVHSRSSLIFPQTLAQQRNLFGARGPRRGGQQRDEREQKMRLQAIRVRREPDRCHDGDSLGATFAADRLFIWRGVLRRAGFAASRRSCQHPLTTSSNARTIGSCSRERR